ncbi:hypothetical protein FKR81_39600 [Lentzea tibetensis]|uniref:Uncharacterized protein n=1 Tax=Lentzea tibetensis TaxID=2591470 RepID=A0A563EGA4_9PSEU|nr:hypothetical protein [Lentzea tibetensis]TWP45190.1 hypothetical protein FKR81_39600 [Lentzea tibetensis]
MFKVVAAVCAAAALSLAVSPAAQASEPSPVAIQLTPRDGLRVDEDGTWIADQDDFYFRVSTSDAGDENLDELTLFVSIPDEIELFTISAEWECWDVDGGVECHNPRLMVPGESWPDLLIYARVHDEMDAPDSIDVYATTGEYGPAHEGVPFQTV